MDNALKGIPVPIQILQFTYNEAYNYTQQQTSKQNTNDQTAYMYIKKIQQSLCMYMY